MENRVETSEQKPGAALVALAVIAVVTAAWWALALWPAGSVESEWLSRTRAACFGSERGGLPDAGGWILLIGEPIGLTATLVAIWGDSLERNLRWALARRRRLASLIVTVAVPLLFVAVLAGRAAVNQQKVIQLSLPPAVAQQVDFVAPSRELVDQRGNRIVLSDDSEVMTLLTFAYGHCSTVCPAIVSDLRTARRERRERMRLAVLTIDPWRDTPDRLATLANHWQLAPADRVLSGSVNDVESVLDALGVARRRNETTGDIDHATTVIVIDEHGRVRWRVDGGGDLSAFLNSL